MLREAADSMAKASTPEPFSTSKTSNWVAKGGGLPAYIQHIAHDIHEKRGMPVSRAIAIAIGVVKRWARGGGKVDAGTRAAAAKAVAEWEALKAKAKARKVSEAAQDEPAVILEARRYERDDTTRMMILEAAMNEADTNADFPSLLAACPSCSTTLARTRKGCTHCGVKLMEGWHEGREVDVRESILHAIKTFDQMKHPRGRAGKFINTTERHWQPHLKPRRLPNDPTALNLAGDVTPAKPLPWPRSTNAPTAKLPQYPDLAFTPDGPREFVRGKESPGKPVRPGGSTNAELERLQRLGANKTNQTSY